MHSSRSFWPDWLDSLQHKGLKDWASWVLDVAGPLNLLGAQILYMAHPLFINNADQMQAIASILEDEDETRAFITYLREQA